MDNQQQTMKPKSPNIIYKEFVPKTIPFSDFLEIENRRYKASGSSDEFVSWLDLRYRNLGQKAWFNKGTGQFLSELGYVSDQKVGADGKFNITQEQADALINTAGTLASLFKGKDKSEYEIALKAECGKPLIGKFASKEYKSCVLNFSNKWIEKNKPTVSAPSSDTKKSSPVKAIVITVVVLGALGTTIYLLTRKK